MDTKYLKLCNQKRNLTFKFFDIEHKGEALRREINDLIDVLSLKRKQEVKINKKWLELDIQINNIKEDMKQYETA